MISNHNFSLVTFGHLVPCVASSFWLDTKEIKINDAVVGVCVCAYAHMCMCACVHDQIV